LSLLVVGRNFNRANAYRLFKNHRSRMRRCSGSCECCWRRRSDWAFRKAGWSLPERKR